MPGALRSPPTRITRRKARAALECTSRTWRLLCQLRRQKDAVSSEPPGLHSEHQICHGYRVSSCLRKGGREGWRKKKGKEGGRERKEEKREEGKMKEEGVSVLSGLTFRMGLHPEVEAASNSKGGTITYSIKNSA